MSDLDELRSSTFEDDFDDDAGNFDDELSIGEGGTATMEEGGFTSTERLIIAALVFVNVLALLFLVYMIIF